MDLAGSLFVLFRVFLANQEGGWKGIHKKHKERKRVSSNLRLNVSTALKPSGISSVACLPLGFSPVTSLFEVGSSAFTENRPLSRASVTESAVTDTNNLRDSNAQVPSKATFRLLNQCQVSRSLASKRTTHGVCLSPWTPLQKLD